MAFSSFFVNCQLRGVRFRNGYRSAESDDALIFSRRPTNAHDRNAIVGLYGGAELGYVEADVAAILSPLIDEYAIGDFLSRRIISPRASLYISSRDPVLKQSQSISKLAFSIRVWDIELEVECQGTSIPEEKMTSVFAQFKERGNTVTWNESSGRLTKEPSESVVFPIDDDLYACML